MIHLDKQQLSSFEQNIRREWVLTNGLGGYAGGSVIGACSRAHHGYLIASLHPPVERFLAFSKTNETLTQGGKVYRLETSQHAGSETGAVPVSTKDVPAEYLRADTAYVATDFSAREPVRTQGQRFLTGFFYNGTVTFSYEAGDVHLDKQLALVRGENTIAIAYTAVNSGEDTLLTITPLLNWRDHGASSRKEDLQFSVAASANGFTLSPKSAPELVIDLAFSEGTLSPREQAYDVDVQYQTEVDNETPGLDTHYCPYDITVPLPAHSSCSFSLLCSVHPAGSTLETPKAQSAHQAVRYAQGYYAALRVNAGFADEFSNDLVLAADQFLAKRASTGLTTVLAGLPWFTDWGRDTMIAFSGLTLATHRFTEAQEILSSFAQYVRRGLVPNMFPDDGQEPLYNTADASLWYFYATDAYLKAVHTPEAYAFVQNRIYPVLCEIVSAYEHGTDFSIHMDTDGLMCAGSGVDQVTWMDVRVGDRVVTPRHGKPVEINALWYNSLCVMAELAARFGDSRMQAHATALSACTAESFREKFWNPDKECLYDVIDGETKDDSIRPNMLYAVSLPHTMLTAEQAAAVVRTAEQELVAGPGIRSLTPAHKDYHDVYCGSLPKRDNAYHQGTAWGFLMGAFITAYLNVHGHTTDAKKQALAFLAPVKKHFYEEGCIGSISEIFDGDSPHTCRGCYAQAWSVGEILRCYRECME